MAKCLKCEKEVSRYRVVPNGTDEPAIICSECSRGPMGYQPFKAYWDTKIADKPVYIESDRQREKLMRENNLAVRPREHIDDLNQRRYEKGMPPLRS